MPAPTELRNDIEWSDYFARTAADKGWTVRRQTTRYFTADRRRGGQRQQIGVAVQRGVLSASRIEVIDTTNVADQVVAWMEEQ